MIKAVIMLDRAIYACANMVPLNVMKGQLCTFCIYTHAWP